MAFGVDVPDLATLEAKAPEGKKATAAQAWRAQLKPASFRGAPFYVDSDEQKGGRRGVTHEFPGRNTPFTEDMGRKARTYSVQAYVLGSSYMAARDALLAALDADGPGALIVPWMPERRVLCTDYSMTESAAEGGMARFQLTFAERGEADSPSSGTLPGVRASSAADAAVLAAGKRLDSTITLAGVPVPVQEGTLAGIKQLGSAVSEAAGIARTAAGLPAVLQMLQNLSVSDLVSALPSELAGPLFSLSGAYSALTSAYGSSDLSGGSAYSSALSGRVDDLLALAAAAPVVAAPSGAGTVRSLTAQNLSALSEYQRNMAVAEAARAAALSSPASRQEAADLRTRIVDAIDGVLDTTRDSSVSMSFTALRTATLQALAQSAGAAPEVASVTTTTVMPSLALAQRYVVSPGYAADAPSAAEEILKRNRVRHPGFVPPGELEVLRAL